MAFIVVSVCFISVLIFQMHPNRIASVVILVGLVTGLGFAIAWVIVEARRDITASETIVSVTASSSAMGVVDNDACDDNRECTVGVHDATTPPTCTYYPLVVGVPCEDVCYETGECDGRGECIGNFSTCHGYCTGGGDCDGDAVFVINELATEFTDDDTGWGYGVLEYPECHYARCVEVVIDVYMAVTTNATWQTPSPTSKIFTPLAARFDCSDYLDPDYYATYGRCLTMERYLLDPNISRIAYDNGYGTGTFPAQLSICIMSFSCSASNFSEYDSVLSVAAEDPSPLPYQSPEQWGFTRVSSEANQPSYGLSATSVLVPIKERQRFWRSMQISVIDKLSQLNGTALRLAVDAAVERELAATQTAMP
jgi:hypothetical protein